MSIYVLSEQTEASGSERKNGSLVRADAGGERKGFGGKYRNRHNEDTKIDM